MKLPNLEQAEVPEAKITEYLLNLNHEQGQGKAQFFLRVGFSLTEWQLLARTLLRHAQEHPVVNTEATRFGTRYVIEGSMSTPNGRIVQVRSVWFIGTQQTTPRLVTAYPLEESDDPGT